MPNYQREPMPKQVYESATVCMLDTTHQRQSQTTTSQCDYNYFPMLHIRAVRLARERILSETRDPMRRGCEPICSCPFW
jgi:hypothetical protein